MILLDVAMAHKRNFVCIESSFATAASLLKKNYQMMFAKAWNFHFDTDDTSLGPTIGNRISYGKWERKALLEQYHGIRVNRLQGTGSSEVVETAERELSKGLPVVIRYDSSFSPWAREADRQSRFLTMFLIVGLDDNGVYCIDLHYTKSRGYIPMDDFLQGCSSSYTTFTDLHEEISLLDWRDIAGPAATHLLEKNNSRNAFDSMNCLADYINFHFNYELELHGETNVVGYPLIYSNPSDLGRGRGLFASTLKYLAGICKAESLVEPANRLYYAESQWMLISSELMKAYLNGKIDNDNLKSSLAARVKAIAALEEQTAASLHKICRDGILCNKTTQCREAAIPATGGTETVLVNLTGYLNNKGFGRLENGDATPDLTGTGEFFLAEGLLEDQLWKVGDMEFSFPAPDRNANDNISCQNQVVNLPCGRYRRLMILGCAEFGVFNVPLLIHYASGEKDEVMIEFIDWGSKDLPKITEAQRPVVAWEGLGLEKNRANENKTARYIYAYQHELQCSSFMESIVLPDCRNVHLFAISLTKMSD